MTLGDKQKVFTKLIAKLILHAAELGFDLTFGEAWRTPEQAALNAKTGKGIKNSLHIVRLAVDFNLFKDGKWLTKTEDFKKLGEYWESLKTESYETAWGGRFGDGNHFSIKHEGRA